MFSPLSAAILASAVLIASAVPLTAESFAPAVESASIGHDPRSGGSQVILRLAKADAARWARLSGSNVGRYVRAVVDGKPASPLIHISTPLTGGLVIFPVASEAEADRLARALADGRSHVKLDIGPWTLD